MKSHAGDNPYLCALCNQELISRNYPQRSGKGHAMNNPYSWALCCKEFISINHPKRHINMNNKKFHITFLFNIQDLLQKIFSFGNICQELRNLLKDPDLCFCEWDPLFLSGHDMAAQHNLPGVTLSG